MKTQQKNAFQCGPNRRRHTFTLALALLTICRLAHGTNSTNRDDHELLKLSLEQLMSMKVTSVSKKEEKLSGTAAAISVITADDIQRSGANNIPDAFRLAPGVDVGRVDAHTWAVGVRGLNDTFSPGLLTLIDGRSIYSPLFSSTFWMAQDVMLEDLSRIEVVRGPGSTLWGANAFNGVINIVSKPADETQGLLVNAGGGSQPAVASSVRWGDKLGDNTFYRIYGKYDQWNDFEAVNGGSANDRWWKMQGGFRLDQKPVAGNEFTLQGDVYHLEANQDMPQVSLSPPGRQTTPAVWSQTGGNILGRWTRTFSDRAELSVQAYYDGERFEVPIINETRHAIDLDIRHQFQLGARQEIVWGGGYRLNMSAFDNTEQVRMLESSQSKSVFNTFVQDQINLVPERLRLTLGSKLEHNDYTGFEVEPGARLAWTPTERQTVWASVSRAVRTPSQFEQGSRMELTMLPSSPPATPATLLVLEGNDRFNSETLIAYEIGYRVQPHARLSLDLNAFVNSYDGLRSKLNQLDPSTLPAYLTVNSTLVNGISGETYGAEIAATWQVRDTWRLSANYSWLEENLRLAPEASSGGAQTARLSAPEQQVMLRSSLNLTPRVDFDLGLRFVGGFSGSGSGLPDDTFSSKVESYFSLDARLAWRVNPNLELSLAGQNLLEEAHREFNPTFLSTVAAQVPRSVFGKVSWRF